MIESNCIFYDGSGNKYIVTENNLEYIPIKPSESSSLFYSGGEYAKRNLSADEYNLLVELLTRAIHNKEIQTDEKTKGNPAIVFGQKTYILKMNAEFAIGLVGALKKIKDAK